MKHARPENDVNREQLDQVLDGDAQAPLEAGTQLRYKEWYELPSGRGSSIVQVIDAGVSDKPPGLSFRRRLLGPETDLVEWFLGQPLPLPPGHRATIFREPRLPSGFPDLVIVIWNASVAERWTPARADLNASDLRLMHVLTCAGPQTECELQSALSSNNMPDSLDRLVEASMIRKENTHWNPCPLSSVFATTQIIAVEAKVNEWRHALNQAHLNTWFTSHSCILVPKIPRKSTMPQDARDLGVTVLTQADVSWDLKHADQHQPRSYISWLFNDWAWKIASQRGV